MKLQLPVLESFYRWQPFHQSPAAFLIERSLSMFNLNYSNSLKSCPNNATVLTARLWPLFTKLTTSLMVWDADEGCVVEKHRSRARLLVRTEGPFGPAEGGR